MKTRPKSFLLFLEPDEAPALDYLNEDIRILEDVLDTPDEVRVFETIEALNVYKRSHNIRGIPITVETDLPKETVVDELKQHHTLFVAQHIKTIDQEPAEFIDHKLKLMQSTNK